VLQPLGLDLRVGEIPGEYCPGDHSISIAGERKVAGIAQRVVKGAALVSTVLVVSPVTPLAVVIADVYAALEIPIDPGRTGALSDALPDIDIAAVEDLLTRVLG
jgi:lipoate-protein ligase A